MVGQDEDCPTFNPDDIDDWNQLTPVEQSEIMDFYKSICALMKVTADQTTRDSDSNKGQTI